MLEWEMHHNHAKYLLYKSLYIFHNKVYKNINLKKIHVMLITVDNVDFVI